jgi:hypothetical protein
MCCFTIVYKFPERTLLHVSFSTDGRFHKKRASLFPPKRPSIFNPLALLLLLRHRAFGVNRESCVNGVVNAIRILSSTHKVLSLTPVSNQRHTVIIKSGFIINERLFCISYVEFHNQSLIKEESCAPSNIFSNPYSTDFTSFVVFVLCRFIV